jgi:hypothetical protein
MLSCEMVGRLGNQMFIAAAAHSLALDNNDRVIYPNSIGGICPTPDETIVHRKTIFRNLHYTNDLSFLKFVYSESPSMEFKEIDYRENLFIKGYFQSENYFKHNREHIIKLFSPQREIEEFINKKHSSLIDSSEHVSVHVRRGDYLKLSDYHNVLGKGYYQKAMKDYDGAKFVFFSDDIEWCRETFKGHNSVFIEKQPDVMDLFLMSKITHNIIANSSFSWWGAWLNQAEKQTVVCPGEWFGPKNSHLVTKDLTPSSWNAIV